MKNYYKVHCNNASLTIRNQVRMTIEKMSFQMMTESLQRQWPLADCSTPELRQPVQKGMAASSRQFDWWHDKMAGTC